MISSFVLWSGVTLSFIGCWDQVAAITLFPYWSWAVIGVLAAYIALRLTRQSWIWLMAGIWMITLLCFADNLVPLLRLFKQYPTAFETRSRTRLRIVTLNCAGSPAAVGELGRWKPDIALLQEIPSTNDLARLAHEWYGDAGTFVAGFDCAIFYRGRLEPVGNRMPPQHAKALAHLPDGRAVLVTSVRFVPPEGRIDLWNPAAWSVSMNNRRLRRTQLEAALKCDGQEKNVPEILGGDFNTPVPDAVFRLLSEFHDAHHEAGRGWGNTVLNKFPIARPDQIWVKGIDAVSARTIRTKNSDHRLVLVDIEVPR